MHFPTKHAEILARMDEIDPIQYGSTRNYLNGSVTYLNSGDWIENLSALEYNRGNWEIVYYDPAAFKEKLAPVVAMDKHLPKLDVLADTIHHYLYSLQVDQPWKYFTLFRPQVMAMFQEP